MTSVAVVGGGVTGLAAAWELAGAGVEVRVLEAGDRLGGRILTEQVRGRPVDLGADAFVARVPDALALCREVGLEDELVDVAAGGAAIWSGGRLRPLPEGLVLGAPTGAAALLRLVRSGLLSPAGAARAAVDLVRPAWAARRLPADPTVAELVAARLGAEVHARVVDPLVGGIHAGPSASLSARSAAPQLAAAVGPSMMRSLRGLAAPPAPGAGPAPLFCSLRGGMGLLVERLGERLRAAGTAIELGTTVEAVPVPGADATVVTTPAPVTSALVARRCPAAAAELGAVSYASVVLAVLVYPAAAFRRPPAGSGFLVAPGEGRLLTACSFGSAKWPHWAAPGEVVLRASAGRFGDGRAMGLGDEELVAAVHGELAEALHLAAGPLEARVARWPAAFPQYRPGHADRVARAEEALARDLPGVELAGAGCRGVGIPACVAQGRTAARRVLARLRG